MRALATTPMVARVRDTLAGRRQAAAMRPPASAFVAHDPRFADVLGPDPRLVRVISTDAHEGPVYVAGEDALYFTSVPVSGRETPRVDLRRLALRGTRTRTAAGCLTTLVRDADAANGMTLDLDGSLLVCQQGGPDRAARIARVDRCTGAVTTVVDAIDGRPLNSPNDVVVGPDGAIWFTDPTYGHLQGFRPAPAAGDQVVRHDPATGATTVVADRLDKPNGLAFSPDGSVLYITDSGANQEPGSYHADRPHHVVAHRVLRGGRLRDARVLFITEPGIPDGLKVDAAGRLYASCARGVQVFDPDGARLGEICLPGAVNFTFGGAERNVLFITTDNAIWAAALSAKGARTTP